MKNILLTITPARHQQLLTWLSSCQDNYNFKLASLSAASADASFRRYYRIRGASTSYIIMDSPPELENPQPFVTMQHILHQAGVRVPVIYEYDAAQGWLLLEDLGQQTLLQWLTTTAQYSSTQHSRFSPEISSYFNQAVTELIKLQTITATLPTYSQEKLRQESNLFIEWYINQHCAQTLTPEQLQIWQQQQQLIIQRNLQGPMVLVHRDYMPRNLMLLADNSLAVLDFQDAVIGPLTYDIACLMQDAFVSWDEQEVIDITVRYWQQAKQAGLMNYPAWHDDFAAFYQAVQWMGLQRHLKVAGIFARLSLRDNKPQYLADVPRFIKYIYHTCNRYHELKPLRRLLEQLQIVTTQDAFSFGKL